MLLIPNKTGILIPARNTKALIFALKKLLESPNLCEKMGKAGRNFAVENFDINRVNSQHLRIYEQLVKNNKRC